MSNVGARLTQDANLRDYLLLLFDQTYNFKSRVLGSTFSSIPLILEIYSNRRAFFH